MKKEKKKLLVCVVALLDADFLEVAVCEGEEDLQIHVLLLKRCLVLGQPQLLQQ